VSSVSSVVKSFWCYFASSASFAVKSSCFWLIAEYGLLSASFRSMALPAFHFPAGELIFWFLGEVRPFCILEQNTPANKARNRPCSISRAERKAYWPKYSAIFRQYTCPFPAGYLRFVIPNASEESAFGRCFEAASGSRDELALAMPQR
jgi:hypothetical protein